MRVMARESAVADYHPQEPPGPGPGALLAQAGAVLSPGEGSDWAHMRERPRQPVIPWDACHPVGPQAAILLTAGAGTHIQPDLMGPTTGYWWDLRALGCWGFTAGSVTVTKNSLTGEQIALFSVPGNVTWSSQKFLRPDDNLVLSATGITGAVQFALEAVEIATGWLPEYLL